MRTETFQFPFRARSAAEQFHTLRNISSFFNARWESCSLRSILASKPREINHRPVAAGVTHISLPLLLPLARHQAAGAPPQSRQHWSSRALCKILARDHLMRCTVISVFFYSAVGHSIRRVSLADLAKSFAANYCTRGQGQLHGNKGPSEAASSGKAFHS